MSRRARPAAPFEPLDLARVRTVPLARRASKVETKALGRPVRAGLSVRALLDGLPDILAARDLRTAAGAIAPRCAGGVRWCSAWARTPSRWGSAR